MPLALGGAPTWLTVDEARRLGRSRAQLFRDVSAGVVRSRREGKLRLFALEDLPVASQIRFTEELTAREAQDRASLESAPLRLARFDLETQRAFIAEAERRLGILQRFNQLVMQRRVTLLDRNCRRPSAELAELLDEWMCTDARILAVRPSWADSCSLRTLQGARRLVREHGAIALIPAAPKKTRPTCLDPEVRARLWMLRLGPLRNANEASIYRRLVAEFEAGVPSLSTIRRELGRIPADVEVYARKGPKTYRGTQQPPIWRDRTGLDVYDLLCGDTHTFDVEIRDDDGSLFRPQLVAFEDERSRAFAGWQICRQGNSTEIGNALLHAIRPKRDPIFKTLWGRPLGLYVDNGKDFCAEFLASGILGSLGIEKRHALPFNAKAKNIERGFGTLAGDFSKNQLFYCGRSPSERTERYRAMRAQHERWLKKEPGASTPFPTMAEFKKLFEAWVIEFMTRAHAGLTRQEGEGRQLSPAEVAAFRASEPRQIPEATLAMVLMHPVERTVEKSHVHIHGQHYYALELAGLNGEKVQCRVDATDLSYVIIENGREHIRAELVSLVPMALAGAPFSLEAKKALDRQRRHDKLVREQYVAMMTRGEELPIIKRQDPAPPAAPAPAGVGTIEMRPELDRAARVVAELRERAPEPPAEDMPLESLPMMVIGGDNRDELQRHLDRHIGPRPPDPHRLWSEERKRGERESQRYWDEQRALLVEEFNRRRQSA